MHTAQLFSEAKYNKVNLLTKQLKKRKLICVLNAEHFIIGSHANALIIKLPY